MPARRVGTCKANCKDPDVPTVQTTDPYSPDQAGSARLREIRQNIIDQGLGGINDIIASGNPIVREANRRTVFRQETSSREESVKNCRRLISTLDALQSPVLQRSADISRSVSLRQCYFTLGEFSEQTCRTALGKVNALARGGGRASRNKTTGERVNSIKDFLDRNNGDCPTVYNLLGSGGGPGAQQPIITLSRSGDVNPTPNLRNVLNDFVNVQYHISLSMIPETESRRIQNKLARAQTATENETIDDLRQQKRVSGSVTIASTGENERNEESLVEEPPDEYSLEQVDNVIYNEFGVKQVRSNLQLLADLWNGSLDSNPSVDRILDSPDFRRTAERVGQETFRLRELRDRALARRIELLQSSDNVLVGETVTRDVSDRNYYNIKSMKVRNVHGVRQNDPYISNMVTMEMLVAEPHGLSLNEDIKNLAIKLGYHDVNPGRVVFKVDIWFSGYNPATGDWVQNISLNTRGTDEKPLISYYVNLTNMEANFSTVGTEYKLSFAPQGMMAIRPEEFSLEGTTLLTGGNPTLGTFLNKLATALNKKRRDETKEALGGAGVNRIYKFFVPAVLENAPFYQDKFLQRNNLIGEDPKDGNLVTIGKDIDIMSLLQSVLADLPEVQTAFLTSKDNVGFIDPVTHFTIRFNARFITKRPEMHDYDGIVYEYIIEPFLTYKKLGFDNTTIGEYTSPESQRARIENMLKLGMITRVYDYINTSENTDVINFDITLNRFYFETLKRSIDPGARKGIGTASTPVDLEEIANKIGLSRELNVNLSQNLATATAFSPEEESFLQKVFGPGESNATNVPLKKRNEQGKDQGGDTKEVSGFHILQASLNTTPDPDSFGSTSSDGDVTKTKDEYLQRFHDHFRNDLMSLDSLEVRGDPVWLMSPYATANNNTLLAMDATDPLTKIPEEKILQPHGDKVIFLNIKETDQFDYMNPDRGEDRGRGNPNIMAGFYGVTGVESVFEGGKFIQKLEGYKMAHLNYAGQNLIVESIAAEASKSEFDEIPEGLTTSEFITQILDAGAKLPQYAAEARAQAARTEEEQELKRDAKRVANETIDRSKVQQQLSAIRRSGGGVTGQ